MKDRTIEQELELAMKFYKSAATFHAMAMQSAEKWAGEMKERGVRCDRLREQLSYEMNQAHIGQFKNI